MSALTILPGLTPVFNTKVPTVFPITFEGDPYQGAHRFLLTHCAGFIDGETKYDASGQSSLLQFVYKSEDGTTIPGLQTEQVLIALIDRVAKLNLKYPCEENSIILSGLCTALHASDLRVKNRIQRNVMGDLKS